MKIAITGGLGHIGSGVLREFPLRFSGLEFLILDDLSTQRYSSLFHLPSSACYQFVEEDILKADLVRLFQGTEVVLHLAAITNATESFTIRDRVNQINDLGTIRVAEACAFLGIPMVFPSTTSVYGTQSERVDEDCPETDLKPQSPYAESKLRAEKKLVEISKTKGLKHVTFRFGTIFGVSPGMRFHTAINKFCWQAIIGQPVTVWKTALHQHRPYLALLDAIGCMEFFIKNNIFDGRVYNVVTQNATVHEILEGIRGFIPGLKIELVDSVIMNQLSYFVMGERVKKTGFECKGSLNDGIRETLKILESLQRHGER